MVMKKSHVDPFARFRLYPRAATGKFLYLSEVSYTHAWLHGGDIPLEVASTYKSKERNGIYTPDENIIDDSTHDVADFKRFFDFGDNAQGNTFVNCSFGGRFIPHMKINRRHEDGVVFCLSNSFKISIAERMKKVACMQIHDVDKLQAIMDKQIGKQSIAGSCSYTHLHYRGHFEKSYADAWQDEYRFFWHHDQSVKITLPPGIAKLVWSL